MKIQPIETPRLYLRPFKAEDARFAVSIWNDPETGKYLPDEAMEDIDEAYLKEIEALPDDPDCCYLIAERKESRERIGTCSFIPSQDGQAYDIAYCVHPAHWRCGYATEMAGGMLSYAVSQGANKLTARVNKENEGSNKLVCKLGFRPVGEFSYKKRGTDVEFTDILYELPL